MRELSRTHCIAGYVGRIVSCERGIGRKPACRRIIYDYLQDSIQQGMREVLTRRLVQLRIVEARIAGGVVLRWRGRHPKDAIVGGQYFREYCKSRCGNE